MVFRLNRGEINIMEKPSTPPNTQHYQKKPFAKVSYDGKLTETPRLLVLAVALERLREIDLFKQHGHRPIEEQWKPNERPDRQIAGAAHLPVW